MILSCLMLMPTNPEWFGFFTRGDAARPVASVVQEYQREHIANLDRLHKAGHLMIAGPLRDPTQHRRGIIILSPARRADIPTYFRPDPYVGKGMMRLELHPWRLDHGTLHTTGIDPNAIEPYHIAILRGLSSAPPVPIGIPGLAASGQFLDSPIRIAFFTQTSAPELQQRLRDWASGVSTKTTSEVIPWWAAKGTLRLP